MVADHRALLTELLADIDRLLRADTTSDAAGDEYDLAREMANAAVLDDMRARLIARRRGIEAALARLDDGTFGRCACGSEISPARLRVFPDASLCVPCQSGEEARRAKEVRP